MNWNAVSSSPQSNKKSKPTRQANHRKNEGVFYKCRQCSQNLRYRHNLCRTNMILCAANSSNTNQLLPMQKICESYFNKAELLQEGIFSSSIYLPETFY